MSILRLFRRKAQVERLPRVLQAMESLINEQESDEPIPRDRELDYDYDHMKQSVKYGRLVAAKRQIEPDLACIACAMQNVGSITTGVIRGHAEAGYLIAREMLLSLGDFPPAEVEQIATAIRRHSDKSRTDTPLDELVKDVDIYVRYINGDSFTRPDDVRRLNAIKAEFHL